VQRCRRLFPERLTSLIDLEPGRFKVLDPPLGELAVGIVRAGQA
jgi:hypothetical protein